MKDKLKTVIGIFIIILIVMFHGGIRIYQKNHYTKIMNALHMIESRKVLTFRIYPRVILPIGDTREYRNPDPIIEEFFQSLTDIQSYVPSHDKVISHDYAWFLEVFAKGGFPIQIHFSKYTTKKLLPNRIRVL